MHMELNSCELNVVDAYQMILTTTRKLELFSRAELQTSNGEMMSLAKSLQNIKTTAHK